MAITPGYTVEEIRNFVYQYEKILDGCKGMSQIDHDALPCPRDIPQALLLDRWDPDFGDLAQRQHSGQAQGITLISLDLIAWGL